MTPIFRVERVIFDLKKSNFSCLTSRMAINIYKEKNLGADNTKNKKILLLILGFLLEKSVLKSNKNPVNKGFSHFRKGTFLLF